VLLLESDSFGLEKETGIPLPISASIGGTLGC